MPFELVVSDDRTLVVSGDAAAAFDDLLDRSEHSTHLAGFLNHFLAKNPDHTDALAHRIMTADRAGDWHTVVTLAERARQLIAATVTAVR